MRFKNGELEVEDPIKKRGTTGKVHEIKAGTEARDVFITECGAVITGGERTGEGEICEKCTDRELSK